MKVVTADAVKDALDDKDGLGIEFDTEYANSVLSAPAAVPELDSDVIHRLETLEKEISELKGQMELQDKKLRQRLNSFKKNLQKGLAKVVRQERKRTDNIIKGFIRYVSRYDLLRTGKADDDQSWKSIPLNKNEENEELDSADIV
jgi:dsDNA-specific endonuclease/ATPase MutS2